MRLPARTQAYLFLLIPVTIWGIAGVIIKLTLPYISPFAFLFWRFVLNLILFLPAYLIWQIKFRSPRHQLKSHYRLKLLGLGMMFGLMLSLIFVGFEHTTAIEGVLLSSLSPLFIVAGGAYFLHETITRRENLGLFITLLGVLITIIQPFISNQIQPLSHLTGNLLVLSSSIFFAVWFLITKHYLNDKASIMDILWYQIIGAFIVYLPLAILEQAYLSYGLTGLTQLNLLTGAYRQLLILPTLIPPVAWLGIIYMSILATIMANWANFQGLQRIEASEATVFTYLQPVVTAPIAFLVLDEIPTTSFLVGIVLIFAGIYILEKR